MFLHEKQIGPLNRLSILQMVSAEPPAAARKKKTAANHLAAKFPYVCCNMALEGSLQDLAANRHNERACRKEAAKTTFGVALKKTQLSMCFFGCCRGRQSKMLSAWMQLPKRQHKLGNLTGKVQWLNMEDLWAALDQNTQSAPGLGLLWSQGLQTRFLTDNAGMKCWARHQGLLHWHDVDQQALQQHTRIVELCG